MQMLFLRLQQTHFNFKNMKKTVKMVLEFKKYRKQNG